MTIRSRVSLKDVFENGDTLEGDNLADLIDSYIHLTDTTAQSVASEITFTGSATFSNINAQNIGVSSLNAGNLSIGSILTSSLEVTTILSAANVHVSGTFSAVDIFGSSVNALIVTTNLIGAGQINVSAVSAGVVNAGQVNASAVSAGSIGVGIINVSAVSGGQIWASALNVYDVDLRVDTSVQAFGTGSATPASVAGFIKVNINGTPQLIAFYDGT